MEQMKVNPFLAEGRARGECTPTRSAQIPEAMAGLNDQTMRLREKISSLESRLVPILIQIPEKGMNAKIEKAVEMVGLASYLHAQARNVAECIEAIDSILSRCEL